MIFVSDVQSMNDHSILCKFEEIEIVEYKYLFDKNRFCLPVGLVELKIFKLSLKVCFGEKRLNIIARLDIPWAAKICKPLTEVSLEIRFREKGGDDFRDSHRNFLFSSFVRKTE
jgi:hypothetical protein